MPPQSQFLAQRLRSPCKHEIIDVYDDFFGLILPTHSAANKHMDTAFWITKLDLVHIYLSTTNTNWPDRG